MASLKENVLASGFVAMTEDELYEVNGGRMSRTEISAYSAAKINDRQDDFHTYTPHVHEVVYNNGMRRIEIN